MTPDTPTRQRHRCLTCDSCGHAEKTNSKTYPFKCLVSKPIPMMVHEYCIGWFGYVGCASHTSPPAPVVVETADECIRITTFLTEKGKESIRKAEREQVLWELETTVSDCDVGGNCAILKKIESLRAQQEQP